MLTAKRITIAVVVFFFFFHASYSQDSGRFRDKQEEIFRAWRSYMTSLDHISGQVDVSMSATDGLDFRSKRRFTLSYPYLSIEHLGENDDVVSRRLFNSRYMFSLKYESSDPIVGEIDLIKRSKRWFDNANLLEEVNGESTKNAVLLLVGAPLRLFPFWLPSLMKSEEFAITGIEYRDENGEPVADVSFDNRQTVRENPKMNLLGGKLTLLPDKYWLPIKAECLIEEFDINDREEYHVSLENHYDFAFDPPVLVRQQRTTVGAKERGEGETVVSNLSRIGSVDKKAFTLSHYGFPEPRFEEKRISPARVVLVLLGVLLILRALFLIPGKKETAPQP